jgi:hypothetical protein
MQVVRVILKTQNTKYREFLPQKKTWVKGLQYGLDYLPSYSYRSGFEVLSVSSLSTIFVLYLEKYYKKIEEKFLYFCLLSTIEKHKILLN